MRRISPSLVVAVLALVLAAGGTGYAAGKITSRQIQDNTIQSRDIRNGTVTSQDVKDGSLTGADLRNRTVPRTKLNRACAVGEAAVFGGCVRLVASGPTSQQAAVDDCNRRNGRLPTIGELRWIGTHDEFTWADGNANQYEFSSDWTDDYPHTPIGLDAAGFSVTNASGQLFWHHCVTS